MPQSSESGFYPPQTAPATSFQPKPGEPRFLDQVANACRVKHLACRTEQAYAGWVKRFILFHNERHPIEMGASELPRRVAEHNAAEHSHKKCTSRQAGSVLKLGETGAFRSTLHSIRRDGPREMAQVGHRPQSEAWLRFSWLAMVRGLGRGLFNPG
jgi:Phage integrase, N-terminal SAM-like domain